MAGVDIMSVMFSMQRSCSIEVSQIINLNILYAQYKNKKRKIINILVKRSSSLL